MTVDSFTAVAMCPRCGTVDVHPFRMPRKNLEDFAYLSDDGMARMVASLGYPVRWPSAHEEAVAEVVRQCKCGWEWAQS